MKKNLLKYLVLAVLAASAVASCSDSENSSPEPINISLRASGDNLLNISLTSPRDTTVRLTAKLDAVSDRNVTATIKTSLDEVERYNNEHGTSYRILPGNCYSFDKDEIIFPRYNTNSSSVVLSLNTSPLEDDDVYLLPLVVDQVDGDENISVSESGTVYILFSKIPIPDPVMYTALDDPDEPWEVVYVSSEYPGEYAIYAIDGREDNFWHHKYGEGNDPPPFDLVIDLKKEMDIYGVQFVARTNPLGSDVLHRTGVLAIVDLAVAKQLSTTTGVNPNDFEGLTSFDENDLPRQKYNDAYLTSVTRGRYVWLRVYRAYSNENPTYTGCSLAEMYVWGLIPE